MIKIPKWFKMVKMAQVVKISKWTKLSKYLNNCQFGKQMCSKFENGESGQNGVRG